MPKAKKKGNIKNKESKNGDVSLEIVPVLRELNARMKALEKDSMVTVVKPPIIGLTADMKSANFEVPNKAIMEMLKNGRVKLNKPKNGKFEEFDTKLCVSTGATGSANTYYNTTHNCVPGAAGEFAAFQVIFSEYMTKSFTLYAKVTPLVGGLIGSATAADNYWVMAYDPLNSAPYALAGFPSILCMDQHIGPFAVTNAVTPLATTTGKDYGGFYKKKFIVPDKGLAPVISTELLDGNWCSITDAGAIVGYLLPAITALGSSVTADLDMFIVYDVKFRLRG